MNACQYLHAFKSLNLNYFTWFAWAQGHFTSLPMAGNLEGCNTCFSSFRGETMGNPG